ncbi:MAG: phosphate acyltransferase [Luteolibacter sp.]
MKGQPAESDTGMQIIQHLLDQLRRHPKRVVFTEGEDIRVIRAAARLVREEVVAPILLGDRSRIHELAEKHQVPMRFIHTIDPATASDFDLFCKRVANSSRYRGMPMQHPEELVVRPHYFGALMVQYGQADAIVGGNQALPAAFFRALLHTIKPMPDVPKIFGVSLLLAPHLKHVGQSGILLMADTAMIPLPSVDELAAIAVDVGKLAHHFLGRRPVVAMLSHSTKGSATTPDAQRVVAATSLAKDIAARNFLDLGIEGEVQADVALDPLAAEVKLPGSENRPAADALVFPNLDAAHISLKLLEHMAGAQSYGRLIRGLARPAAQVPRTASEETIFGTAAAIAVEAIKFHQLYPDGEV